MKSILTIVGMKHRGTEKLVANLPQGEPLTLIREPTNQYDPHAVQVWGRDQHLGFVKGTQARDVARFMDDGKHAQFPAVLAVTADRWPCAELDTDQRKPTAARAVKEGWKNG